MSRSRVWHEHIEARILLSNKGKGGPASLDEAGLLATWKIALVGQPRHTGRTEKKSF